MSRSRAVAFADSHHKWHLARHYILLAHLPENHVTSNSSQPYHSYNECPQEHRANNVRLKSQDAAARERDGSTRTRPTLGRHDFVPGVPAKTRIRSNVLQRHIAATFPASAQSRWQKQSYRHEAPNMTRERYEEIMARKQRILDERFLEEVVLPQGQAQLKAEREELDRRKKLNAMIEQAAQRLKNEREQRARERFARVEAARRERAKKQEMLKQQCSLIMQKSGYALHIADKLHTQGQKYRGLIVQSMERRAGYRPRRLETEKSLSQLEKQLLSMRMEVSCTKLEMLGRARRSVQIREWEAMVQEHDIIIHNLSLPVSPQESRSSRSWRIIAVSEDQILDSDLICFGASTQIGLVHDRLRKDIARWQSKTITWLKLATRSIHFLDAIVRLRHGRRVAMQQYRALANEIYKYRQSRTKDLEVELLEIKAQIYVFSTTRLRDYGSIKQSLAVHLQGLKQSELASRKALAEATDCLTQSHQRWMRQTGRPADTRAEDARLQKHLSNWPNKVDFNSVDELAHQCRIRIQCRREYLEGTWSFREMRFRLLRDPSANALNAPHGIIDEADIIYGTGGRARHIDYSSYMRKASKQLKSVRVMEVACRLNDLHSQTNYLALEVVNLCNIVLETSLQSGRFFFVFREVAIAIDDLLSAKHSPRLGLFIPLAQQYQSASRSFAGAFSGIMRDIESLRRAQAQIVMRSSSSGMVMSSPKPINYTRNVVKAMISAITRGTGYLDQAIVPHPSSWMVAHRSDDLIELYNYIAHVVKQYTLKIVSPEPWPEAKEQRALSWLQQDFDSDDVRAFVKWKSESLKPKTSSTHSNDYHASASCSKYLKSTHFKADEHGGSDPQRLQDTAQGSAQTTTSRSTPDRADLHASPRTLADDSTSAERSRGGKRRSSLSRRRGSSGALNSSDEVKPKNHVVQVPGLLASEDATRKKKSMKRGQGSRRRQCDRRQRDRDGLLAIAELQQMSLAAQKLETNPGADLEQGPGSASVVQTANVQRTPRLRVIKRTIAEPRISLFRVGSRDDLHRAVHKEQSGPQSRRQTSMGLHDAAQAGPIPMTKVGDELTPVMPNAQSQPALSMNKTIKRSVPLWKESLHKSVFRDTASAVHKVPSDSQSNREKIAEQHFTAPTAPVRRAKVRDDQTPMMHKDPSRQVLSMKVTIKRPRALIRRKLVFRGAEVHKEDLHRAMTTNELRWTPTTSASPKIARTLGTTPPLHQCRARRPTFLSSSFRRVSGFAFQNASSPKLRPFSTAQSSAHDSLLQLPKPLVGANFLDMNMQPSPKQDTSSALSESDDDDILVESCAEEIRAEQMSENSEADGSESVKSGVSSGSRKRCKRERRKANILATMELIKQTCMPTMTFRLDSNRVMSAIDRKKNKMPYFSYEFFRDRERKRPPLHYCKSFQASEKVAAMFLEETILGFDLEWNPNIRRLTAKIKDTVSVIQLASPDRIAIFQLALHKGSTAEEILPPTLRKIMESESIIKTGVGIAADCTRLRTKLNIQSKGIIELSHLHNLLGDRIKKQKGNERCEISRRLVSLAKQVETHLYMPLHKGDVRTSKWHKELGHAQCAYAANDVWASVCLFYEMERKRLEMDPVPDRPGFAEEGLPVYGAPKTESELGKDVVAAVSSDDDSFIDDDEASEEFTDQSSDSWSVTSDIEEPLDSQDVLDREPGSDFDEDLDIDISQKTTSIAGVHSDGPITKNGAVPELVALAAATRWVASYTSTVKVDRELRVANHKLHAYTMWHHQRAELSKIAQSLDRHNRPALVAAYILDAIELEGLSFDSAKVQQLLELIPSAQRQKYEVVLNAMQHEEK